MFQSNVHPYSKVEKKEWSPYSDIENLIIEDAYSEQETQATLDEYYVDFQSYCQMSTTVPSYKRPIKRITYEGEMERVGRSNRFLEQPLNSTSSFTVPYGWISPFISEVRRALRLKENDLPSKNSSLIPLLVEKAAEGIIKEGKTLGKKHIETNLANILLKEMASKIEEVWICCVRIYTFDSFLYEVLNKTMRLIGSKQNEEEWRSKIETLGPYCLLLWDDPIHRRLVSSKTLYRGGQLTQDEINMYRIMARARDQYWSFSSFLSCSRNQEVAAKFANVLFVLCIDVAFVADLTKFL